jgi:hypothetical protein
MPGIIGLFDIPDTGCPGQGEKIGAQMGAGGLRAGGAVAAVVQDHQEIIIGRMMGDGGQRPQVHEHGAIPIQDHHLSLRAGQG